MATQPIKSIDDRSEPRDAVFCRTRLVLADRRSVSAVVVNLSPQGLMLRAEADVAPGDHLRLTLPEIGAIDAVVRWTLGGRLGCQFSRGIETPIYTALLATIAA